MTTNSHERANRLEKVMALLIEIDVYATAVGLHPVTNAIELAELVSKFSVPQWAEIAKVSGVKPPGEDRHTVSDILRVYLKRAHAIGRISARFSKEGIITYVTKVGGEVRIGSDLDQTVRESRKLK